MDSKWVACDRAPAEVGVPLDSVDTPAAVVDLNVLEANIRAAVALVKRVTPANTTVTIRPHMKAHKCPGIAALQIALSEGLTKGMLCQKVVEAEAAVAAGIMDLLVSNQVVDPVKIRRMTGLVKQGASVAVLADSADNVRTLSSIACENGVTLTVLVEVDVGQRRCGVSGPAAAVELGQLIASLPGLKLGGIQCYHGGAQHVRSVEERAEIVAGVCAIAGDVRAAFAAAGLPCDVITGGGTGSFWMEAASGIFTEVQPGSYIFSDADYARNELDPAAVPGGWAVAEAEADHPNNSSPQGRTSFALDDTSPYNGAVGNGSAGSAHHRPHRQCWEAPFAPSLFLLTQVMSRRVQSDFHLPHIPGGSPSGGDPTTGSSGSGSSSTGTGTPIAGLFSGIPHGDGGKQNTGGGAHLPRHSHHQQQQGQGHAASGNGRNSSIAGGATGSHHGNSHPHPPPLPQGWVVVDSGLKAQSTDSGNGVVVGTVAEYISHAANKAKLIASAAEANASPSGEANPAPAASGSGSGSGAPSPSASPSAAAAAKHHSASVMHWDASLGQFRSSVGHLTVRSVSDEHSTLAPIRAPVYPPAAAVSHPADGAAAPVAVGSSGSGNGDANGSSGSPTSASATPTTIPYSVDEVLPSIGTKLLVMPGHCDPFVNHYDWLVGFRADTGRVEAVWRVAARSPGV